MKSFNAAVKFTTLAGLVSSPHVMGEAIFRPSKISFDVLQNDPLRAHDTILQALSSVGIIAVTDIPHFENLKRSTLPLLPACIDARGTQDAQHIFPDGTVRRTVASHRLPGSDGLQAMRQTDENDPACQDFTTKASPFRDEVSKVTAMFAKHVGAILGNTEPLLKTREGFAFDSFSDVVEYAEHLEHFHSYYQRSTSEQHAATPGSLPTNPKDTPDDIHQETVEWHVDQGMFLVFTPGLIVPVVDASEDDDATAKNNPPLLLAGEQQEHEVRVAADFYIELPDGSRALVDFDGSDLVFLLGDGVDQIVHHRDPDSMGTSLQHDDAATASGVKLRAVPHALKVQDQAPNEARVWYGRMVLPPSRAIHPTLGMSFGELREAMIKVAVVGGHDDHGTLALGCSSSTMVARQLAQESCAEGELLCWHQCMSLQEYNVSEDICSDRNLDLKCVNPRNQLWNDSLHGDYYPACSNSTAFVTPLPTLTDYPRDNDTCTQHGFESFASSVKYMASMDVGPTGKLFWNITDDGRISGRLAFNGLFGYLGLGLANKASENVMLGASIILALPGGNYSAAEGLDLSLGPQINEYQINGNHTDFRFWQVPVDSATAVQRSNFLSKKYDIEESECFTALIFETASINGIPFNISGEDFIIWAGNGVDFFAGYHGEDNHGHVMVDWSAAKTKDEDKGDASSVSKPRSHDVLFVMCASLFAAFTL